VAGDWILLDSLFSKNIQRRANPRERILTGRRKT
jgi:hypothetical protein